MIRPTQLRDTIIRPVLLHISGLAPTHDQSGSDIEPAVELLMGTAMQESQLGNFIAQVHGPALGVWQMEPATEKDIWTNYLAFRGPLSNAVSRLTISGFDRTAQLAGNLYYACAMARVRYMRATDPLPKAGDLNGQAAYYLKNYNAGGKATLDQYVENWHTLQAQIAKEG